MVLIDTITNALNNNKCVLFDYVAKDRTISYKRLVKPQSVQEVGKNKDWKMYGTDLNKGVMRCFDLEGMMNTAVVNTPRGGENKT